MPDAGSGLAEEIAVMRELPERRLESCKRERVKVDSGSLIYADRNVYSVPSRLIGEQVEVRLYMERVEVWYGQKKVEEMPRLRGRQKHGWIIGTSSTGWCESRGPWRTIATATSCFPRADSAWRLTDLRSGWPVAGEQGISGDPGTGGQGERGQSR